MHKRFASILLAIALAAPAGAQMTPSSPEAISAAVVDCWQAANGLALDEAQLQARGWQVGSMKGPDGKAIESPLRFYGKSDSAVMMMVMNTANAAGCTVVSRVAKTDDIGASAQMLLDRLVAIDPEVKGSRQGQSIVYVSGQRAAVLEPTGTMEKPSTRIVVAFTAPEKK